MYLYLIEELDGRQMIIVANEIKRVRPYSYNEHPDHTVIEMNGGEIWVVKGSFQDWIKKLDPIDLR